MVVGIGMSFVNIDCGWIVGSFIGIRIVERGFVRMHWGFVDID